MVTPAGSTRSGKSSSTTWPVSLPGVGQVVRPRAAPVGPVDPLEERGDDLAQLLQHHVGVDPGLGQRVGPHPHQQHLVGLAGAVDADVGQRPGRQQPAQGVEALGPDGLAVDEVGVAAPGGDGGPPARPGPPRGARRRCRTSGPCRPRSGRRAASRAGPGRGSTGSARSTGAGCRRCSGSTARGRPSADPTRAPWSGRWTPARRPGGRRRAGPPSRRRTRRRPSRRGPRPASGRRWRRPRRRR